MILTLLTSVIAICGMALLTVLYRTWRNESSHLRLKLHRNHRAGLADLLIYGAVVDKGIIINKDGSFMAAWTYQGLDSESATDEEREQLSFHLNQVFRSLGSGWMLHVDAVKRPTPNYPLREQSHFPDSVSQLVDEDRRKLFERAGTLFEGKFILVLTWCPPSETEKKLGDLMFSEHQETPSQGKNPYFSHFQNFKKEIQNIESRLSVPLRLERLSPQRIKKEGGFEIIQDEFSKWLHFCVTGLDHPITLPKTPMYLDALIGGVELWSGLVPKIGNNFLSVVAIEGFPLSSHPGILNVLSQLPVSYRWSSRFIFMDSQEAISSLSYYRKLWKQKVRNFLDQMFQTQTGPVNLDAENMVDEAQTAISGTQSGMMGFGYYTSAVILMDEDSTHLAVNAQRVEKCLQSLGFTARIETINTLEAWLGCLPGHGVENIRRPLLSTFSLADLLPTNSLWTGEDKAPCPLFSSPPPQKENFNSPSPSSSFSSSGENETSSLPPPPLMQTLTNGSAPFRLNLHVRDLGHTLMFGPTRSGKSTHLGMIALQFRRYKGAQIFAFDKGMSMYPVCKAVGGAHYTISAESDSLSFAPLSDLSTPSRMAFAMEWIQTLMELAGVPPTPRECIEISQSLLNFHRGNKKTLTDFCHSNQNMRLREVIWAYTVKGLMGHLLDAPQDDLQLSDFMTFELEELMGMGDKYALPVLLYLFRRIEEALDGRPTLIILDEAWIMLGHPVFREKIREWLKTLAKKNCAVLMATQNISDASSSGILDVLVESTATKIFLPNIYAAQEDGSELYKRMGLNKRQIQIISEATPKQDYYTVSESGCRLYELALSPIALAFVGATDKYSLKRIQTLEKQWGTRWPLKWLEEKGVLENKLQGEAA